MEKKEKSVQAVNQKFLKLHRTIEALIFAKKVKINF
jgi:hypothetical protein